MIPIHDKDDELDGPLFCDDQKTQALSYLHPFKIYKSHFCIAGICPALTFVYQDLQSTTFLIAQIAVCVSGVCTGI